MYQLVIDDRPIIPVRLIPYATGWNISPDALVQMLSKSDKWNRVYLPSYYLLPDKSFKAMLPKEWDVFNSDLSILSDKLHAGDQVEGESYPAWRKQSIVLIPPGTFTWLDEFEEVYARMESRIIRPDERPGDRDINLNPYIPQDMRELVFEGFEQETEYERAWKEFSTELPDLRTELSELMAITPESIAARREKKSEVERLESRISEILGQGNTDQRETPLEDNQRSTPVPPAEPESMEIGTPEWRSQIARKAADARHDQPGGSRDKQQQIRDIWATGKYSTRDRCAEEECAALGMSYSAARKALRNTPGPAPSS